MIPNELRALTDTFFAANAHKFDLSHASGCGEYMESLIPYAQTHGYPEVGYLKKYGSGTQYNGHAIDAFLWKTPDEATGKLQSCDVIANGEAKPPYSGSNPAPSAGWSLDTPRYEAKDWSHDIPGEVPVPAPNTVPWVPYDENSFQRLKRLLSHDYARRPQGADFDVSVWSGRYFHNATMGPDRVPLGEQKALEKIKPELCGALGISVQCDGLKCNHPAGTVYLGE